MQTFEFQFNPKTKPELIFDSFCFEPANIYEKKAGSLYMAGFLKNALPQNARFLDNLAKTIRERYYKLALKSSEKALKESLRLANDYLEQIAKKGDVSWLGNLSFAAISLKNFDLNFTKVGEIKILLMRKGQIIDIDKRLKFQDLEPYPLKVFPNIVSGKLAENDAILILTKEVFNAFQSRNILSKIAGMSAYSPLQGKQLKEILQKKTEELSRIFGACLLVYLGKEEAAPSRQVVWPNINLPAAKLKRREFSFRAVFNPIFSGLRRSVPRLDLKINLPKLKVPGVPPWNKNLTLALAIVIFVGLGFFISQREESQKLDYYKIKLAQIQEKAGKAKTGDTLNETWNEISALAKITADSPKNFREQVSFLREKIGDSLFELNKMVRLDNPELILEAEPDRIIPQKIISNDKNIYLFSPYSRNLAKIAPNGKLENIEHAGEEKFSSAFSNNDSLFFFSKPNKISLLEDKGFSDILLSPPSSEFSYEQSASFNSNLYFYDRKAGKIIKYPYVGGPPAGGLSWGSPEDWTQNQNAVEPKSMAVDGSIWILNPDDTLSRLYAGTLRETLKIDIFPQPKNFSKLLIIPSLPYLYLLEPAQNRLVILDKKAQIVKQFQSEKFANLLDFSVSDDGKTVYLLNGQKVYKISE